MKCFRTILTLALAILPLQLLAQRYVHNLNSGWQFSTDSTNWRTVDLPHDFQIESKWVAPVENESFKSDPSIATVKSRLSARGFKEMGKGYYAKSFVPDTAWKGKRVLLDFEGIMLFGDAWFNGEPIGGTDYGYLGFEADITDKIKWDQPNEILVVADTGKPENSRWYTGGGLYRDVNVIVTDPKQYFARNPLWIVTPEITNEEALVVVGGEIVNLNKPDSVRVGITITDPKGTVVYSKKKVHRNNRRQNTREFTLDSITIANPMLWDVDSPSLYTLTTTVYRPDGTAADTVCEHFGIRKLEYSPEFGLKLNGKKILLKGIANHHTLGALGAAAFPRAIEKRLRLLKEFGINHIRTSHNPYSKSFLDLCDRYGILVVDELYDKWTSQYAGGRREWNTLWLENIPEWVRRDRNHPSVVMWSLGNETQMLPDMPYNDWGVTSYRLMKTLLERYDSSGRPVTVAMHPRFRNEFTDSIPAPLAEATDVASYNYRYMYFPGDSRRYPDKIFYQSEANASGMGPNFFEMDLDKVLGLAYWGAIDYLGESGGWPAKGWVQGVFDISLRPKPQAYFLKSYFKPDEPVVNIAIIDNEDNVIWNDVQVGTKQQSSHWNRKEESKLNLYTYTNGEEVELLLNSRSLGRKVNETSNPKNRNRIYWENIPYQKGSLEARAYQDGRLVACHKIRTAGKAVRLAAKADSIEWKADGTDLQHIAVEAVDKKGITDPSARQQVIFTVEGPARIVGVINGDNTSNEETTGNTRSLYDGAVTVILCSTDIPGTVTLKASAPGLKPAVIKLRTI